MITNENKSQIDRIWNVFFSNGINNPLSVVEQLTYLLFIKMLDDRELQQEQMANLGGYELRRRIFPTGNYREAENGRAAVPYRNLRWSVFCEMSAQNMFLTVRDHVFEFIKHIGAEDSAYSKYIENARLDINEPVILQEIVEGINGLRVEDDHTMGDIYEYILDTMAANGSSGQFRTPPHIIRMMVDLMQPTPDDIVCDPAMGTAGFLVETAKYIQEHHAALLMQPKVDEHYRTHLFNGFDTDPTMMRIGSMHLMVNGVENPNITRRDSLSNANDDDQIYTLTLANPPFAGSVNAASINPALKAVTSTRKTELLFVAQFIRGLKRGGRCASIVPDGVLFGSSNAHVALRKELVDRQYLKAVISMPSGVFKPYAGVSTAILVFHRTDSGGTDKVWFYDMRSDGYSLDDKRTPLTTSDIPDILARFHHLDAETTRTRKEQSFFVPVEEIRENNYDLSINKYKEIEREIIHYDSPEVIFARIKALEAEVQQRLEHLEGMLG